MLKTKSRLSGFSVKDVRFSLRFSPVCGLTHPKHSTPAVFDDYVMIIFMAAMRPFLSPARFSKWLLVPMGLFFLAFSSFFNVLYPRTAEAPAVTVKDLREAGVIRIGFSVEEPYAFLRAAALQPVGVEAKVAELIIEKLGVPRIEWVLIPFSTLISDLKDGRVDVIASGLFITPEREEQVLFSSPHLIVPPGVLVREGTSSRSLNRLVVIANSAEAQRLFHSELKNIVIETAPDAMSAALMVLNNDASGLALSYPSVKVLAEKIDPSQLKALPWSEFRDNTLTDDLTAFAFRTNCKSLVSQWNTAFESIKGSPEHLEILAEYGFESADALVLSGQEGGHQP